MPVFARLHYSLAAQGMCFSSAFPVLFQCLSNAYLCTDTHGLDDRTIGNANKNLLKAYLLGCQSRSNGVESIKGAQIDTVADDNR